MDLTPIDDFRKSHQVNTKGALAARHPAQSLLFRRHASH